MVPPNGTDTSSRPQTTDPTAISRFHSALTRELSMLVFDEDGTPTPESWGRFLITIDDLYHQVELCQSTVSNGVTAWSSFEHLFEMAPIPLMEQDYSDLEEWMKGLRAQGVTDILAHVGAEVASIRELAPMVKIVAANPAAVAAVGLPKARLIGHVDPGIVNEGSVPSWLAQFEAVWTGTPTVRTPFLAATAQGEQYDAESFLSAPVIDGRPDFSRAVFTLIDVTDYRNEERRMLSLIEAKDRFLASVSHEIRTPLTAVLGFARILDDDRNLEGDDRRLMVSCIAQHAQEVANLIEDLIVAARAEIGQVEVARVATDLGRQVTECLESTVFTGNIRTSGSATALGDPARVRQIVRNLFANAERYGGPNVEVEIVQAGGKAILTVADDGTPLPEPQWDRIFEPYSRAHTTPGQPEPVGIGLAVSRELAHLMGGTLVYDVQGDRGTFTLTLEAASV